MDRISGLCFLDPSSRRVKYLPQVQLDAHTSIISSISRTTLTQTFANFAEHIPEIRYSFPLFDGVTVVEFICTIGERVIRGVVKEKQQAREEYRETIGRRETAGLLEQLPTSADVFTTIIGNIPAGDKVVVQITYLGELKHDAQVDGVRLVIPTAIAPRYGSYPGDLVTSHLQMDGGIRITVDAEASTGSSITSIQSPSHSLAVTLGRTSTEPDATPSLQKASATLALGTAELYKDFILQVKITDAGNPVAILEEHPSIPNQRAIMVTLVPKFQLPAAKPEIVFVCDRSGSMADKIRDLKFSLRLFIKSLDVGVKFNICSFGSKYSFLWQQSRTYDKASMDEAMNHIETFAADFGGTEMYAPLEEAFTRRYKDMNVEVFLLTDGEIWGHHQLFDLINKKVAASNGAIRVFSLGIGSNVSHALIEGVARAGNGFSQSVADNEEMGSKVIRMLKGALYPHVKDYSLEVEYESALESVDDDFEVVDRVVDEPVLPSLTSTEPSVDSTTKPTILLFDHSIDLDHDSTGGDKRGRYSHLPHIETPKQLQAPFTIPPLFPFNRTTVYLLMSEESAQRKPKSVILRGTSDHAPLELQIAVNVLATKGETIHQLAAKKVVTELEQGRGWIYHARESGEQSGLIEATYPGLFLDMAEREAVRLGVQYQVGGMWCSFVATGSDYVPKKPRPTEAKLGRTRRAAGMYKDISYYDLAGTMMCDLGNVRPESLALMSSKYEPRRVQPDFSETEPAGDLQEEDQLSETKYQALVNMQNFEGYWEWNHGLVSNMGWKADKIQPVAMQKLSDDAKDEKIVATACAIAWLRKGMAAKEDSWELLVKKAVAWMEARLGQWLAAEVICIVGDLI
ncbi:hypothetical protein JX266_012367 [Neoarthrinium moseri]|nr:hypothetical protein JX266_012367 [Neoarthrinium moseri]